MAHQPGIDVDEPGERHRHRLARSALGETPVCWIIPYHVCWTGSPKATTFAVQGKDAEAESLFERSRAIQEKMLGLDNAGMARSLGGRAALQAKQVKTISVQVFWRFAPPPAAAESKAKMNEGYYLLARLNPSYEPRGSSFQVLVVFEHVNPENRPGEMADRGKGDGWSGVTGEWQSSFKYSAVAFRSSDPTALRASQKNYSGYEGVAMPRKKCFVPVPNNPRGCCTSSGELPGFPRIIVTGSRLFFPVTFVTRYTDVPLFRVCGRKLRSSTRG